MKKWLKTLAILISLFWVGIFFDWAFSISPAEGKCLYACKSDITNKYRQKVGDLYNPGHGRRIQIRDKHRRIIGYIEANGRVTNTHRQKVLRIKP